MLLGITIPRNYGQRYIDMFDGVFRDVATAFGIPWIEFFMEGGRSRTGKLLSPKLGMLSMVVDAGLRLPNAHRTR